MQEKSARHERFSSEKTVRSRAFGVQLLLALSFPCVESQSGLNLETLPKTTVAVNALFVESFHRHGAIDGSRDVEELERLHPF